MAFGRTRERDHSSFELEGNSFIKQIQDDIYGPWIPRDFMRKFGNALSKVALLRDPNGTLWRIELLKSADDGLVRFQRGWQEFVDFYSLRNGDMLVFEHKGSYSFSVFIYKEMDYQAASVDSVSSNQVGNFEEDGDSDYIKFLAKFAREKSQASYSVSKIGSDDSYSPICTITKRGRPKKKLKSSARKSQGLAHGSGKALQRSSALTVKHPFFKVFVRTSEFTSKSKWTIPVKFSRNFLKRGKGKATLSFNGKIWPAVYNVYETETRLWGWKNFAEENNIKAGDVCIFELIEPAEMKFAVSIYRLDED